jgi:signal transduction histidine kinase
MDIRPSPEINEIVDLVRRVRHDANNPLTAILGNVQLLIEDPAIQDPEVQESLRVVESEVRRLMEILKRLSQIRVQSPAE